MSRGYRASIQMAATRIRWTALALLVGFSMGPLAASAAAPPEPVLTQPGYLTTWYGTAVDFEWEYSPTVEDYYVVVSYDAGFTDLAFAGWLGGNYIGLSLSNMPDNGHLFYWQVLAWNSDGQTWSDVWAFYNGPSAPPATPAPISPPYGGNAPGTAVSFSWSGAERAADYYLEVATDPSFSNPIFDGWMGGVYTGITLTGLFDNGEALYWRVAAWNPAGSTPFSETYYFFNGPSAAPATPALSSPPNGSTIGGSTVAFDWSPAARAADYYLQIAIDPSFATGDLLFDDYVGNYIGIDITGLPDNGTVLYWRVFAWNAVGSSPWSSTWSFTNGPSASPGTPSILEPTGYAGGSAIDFLWNPAPRANDYFLEISLDPGFDPGQQVFGMWIGNYIGITITNLPDNGTVLYWRVKGRNGLGDGPYDTASFTNGPSAVPDAPSLLSPPDGANVAGEEISFTWDSADRATDYYLELSLDATFTDLIFDEWIGYYIGITITGLPDNGLGIYWRVKARNSLGEGPFSEIRWVENGPSSAPDTPNPTDPVFGSNAGGETVLFLWDPAARASDYFFQLALDSSFTSVLFGEWIGYYGGLNLTGLPDDGTIFYWRVKAGNAIGESPFSPYMLFTNGPSSAPDQVNLLSPSNGSAVPGSAITFLWQAAARATDYRFVLAYDPGLTDVVIDTNSGGFLGMLVTGFPEDGRTYYWQVTASNPIGSGPPSPVWSVTNSSSSPPVACTPQIGTGNGNLTSYSHIDSCFDNTVPTYYLEDRTRRAALNPHGHDGAMPDSEMIVSRRFVSLGPGGTINTVIGSDADNSWVETINRSGVDAQVNAGRVYDQLLQMRWQGPTNPGLNSLDGLGMTISSIYDATFCVDNASWSSAGFMIYCTGHPFAAASDVVGHEMGHGVTNLASPFRGPGVSLAYQNESGALNEAFSDWLGTAVESHYKPLNWTLGDPVVVIRDMSDPPLFGQPDTYGGSYWFDWTTCNPAVDRDGDGYPDGSDGVHCGVHTNSGVGNKAFFLMSAGGTHATSNVTVQGIGVDKAILIALRANLNHWAPYETYLGAANGMVSAATWFYGANSNETYQVRNAWAAVDVFELPMIDLQVEPSGAAGSVSGGGDHEWGKSITVVATPNPGYEFDRWSEGGATVSTNPNYTFTVTGDRALVAEFVIAQHQIDVVAVPAVGGSVSGGGLYDWGTTATVVATPAAGYDFSGWYEGGSLVTTSASYAFTVTGDRSLEARFVQRRSLVLSALPTAGGTIQAVPPPGGDGLYPDGTVVTLTAVPNSGYEFLSWSGDAAGATSPVQVILDGDKSVTANFGALYNVSLSVFPPGTGTASGGGIYSDGDTAILTATPDEGYVFIMWSGDASDTSNPLSILVTHHLNVTANFAPTAATYNVTVSVNPPGTGSVTGGGTYSAGETATLVATPAAGYSFLGWSGDVTGSQNPNPVIVLQDLYVTGNFGDTTAPVVTPPPDVAVTATGELTPVSLGSASAFDEVDGPLTPTPDQTGPFPPGTHVVTWSATDSSGNTGTAPQTVSVTPLVGDVKIDGVVNSRDVLTAMRILAGSYTPTAGELQRADVAPIVDGQSSPDGQVNVADLLQIMRIAEGKISP